MWFAATAVVIGLLGLVGHVIKVRQNVYAAAYAQATTAADLLAENTARLFDAADYMIADTSDRTAALDWGAVEHSKALWTDLKQRSSRFPYVDAIWLNDATGRLRLSTVAYPVPASNAYDRNFFQAHLQPDQGATVSEPILGRVTKVPTFLLTRRLDEPDGSFRGIASVTIDPWYFHDFFGRFHLPYAASLQLVRSVDGSVLARQPGPPASEPGTASPTLRKAIDANPEGGLFADDSSIGAFVRSAGWPTYAVVRFDRAAIEAAWHEQVVIFLLAGGLTLIALLSFGLYAARQARAERVRRTDYARLLEEETDYLRRRIAHLEHTGDPG